ncbi:MAG: hypothetical protein L6R39_002316 [Caloplaca ligustica]|nr:MAG: hypothetical protein L6R39_002316 [Caloplaca ligustica]
MALTHLPTELLENIVTRTLPEGFESLALTCKRIHAICRPFIQNHNTLRSRFHNFSYGENTSEWIDTIRTAFDVITRIAVEPVVARYIRYADFAKDSFFTRGRPRYLLADVRCGTGGAVLSLFADSPYLKKAGLDWQEFYAKIEEDLEAVRYSPHAAAFLMTLLPNVETLTLPQLWCKKPPNTTDKLIDAIVRNANRSRLFEDRPSLAQVTRFELYVSTLARERFDLDWAIPFLALPHVRSFYGPSCVAVGGDGHYKNIAYYNPEGGFGKTLVAVNFMACCIDEVGIADFLQHTTCLRTLRYSHTTKIHRGPQDWNLCQFITAIERKVGSHLEELSISIRELHGSIAPGKSSMRGFHRLRKLEFPLEVTVCNITAATACRAATTPDRCLVVGNGSTDEHHELDDAGLLISDLVPASVSQLALTSGGTKDHAKALSVMFRHFAARKGIFPALEEIQLSCPGNADDAHKEQCARLLAETEKVGVVLHLHPYRSNFTITWNE